MSVYAQNRAHAVSRIGTEWDDWPKFELIFKTCVTTGSIIDLIAQVQYVPVVLKMKQQPISYYAALATMIYAKFI